MQQQLARSSQTPKLLNLLQGEFCAGFIPQLSFEGAVAAASEFLTVGCGGLRNVLQEQTERTGD